MKKSYLLMVLAFLLVSTLVFSGAQDEKATTMTSGEVQYGGTLSFINHRTHRDLASWDPLDGYFGGIAFAAPFQQRLAVGDIDKYGPRGSNEFSYTNIEYMPVMFLKGELAESWEVTSDPLGLIFYLRKGVMWTGNKNIGMEPREFVADDVVYWTNRYMNSPLKGDVLYVEKAYARDKYTVVVEFNQSSSAWAFRFLYGPRSGISPPESVEAPGGLANWKNQVGTGAFILTESLPGSHITCERNPDYWEKATIDGKEYQLPFVDKIIQPLIVDPLSQLAALRTGQVDWHTSVKLQYEEEFAKTNPDMLKYKYLLANLRLVAWKSAPGFLFNNKNLRRAMMIGTDMDTVIKSVFMEGEKECFPFNSNSPTVFTPMDQMPASVQELFNYDPDKAKAILAEEGYPNGFDIELVIRSDPDFQDIGALLASQWAKFGVKANLKTLEVTVHDNMRGTHDYQHGFLWETGASIIPNHASVGLFYEGRRYNMADYDNPEFNELYLAAEAEMDDATMSAMIKDVSVMLIDEAPYLPLGSPFQISMTWPWVKNYFGEVEAGFINYEPMINRIWIDQELKKSMGY